jgi:peptidoglycan/xylan/chitin deacetylase (PgdA/CDA1 family)
MEINMNSNKLCCLSFDDGPNLTGSVMNDMLDVLEKHGVIGSFFLIGNKINSQNEAIIKRAMALGCDIENHSWSHPDAVKEGLTKAQIEDEFLRTEEAIFNVTGRHTEFYRPPYISVNRLMYKAVPRPFICGHACEDWITEYSADELLEKMMNGVQDGVIFLLHVGETNLKTVEVVDRAIPILKSQGYDFVTVPELFEQKKVKPKLRKLWTVVE